MDYFLAIQNLPFFFHAVLSAVVTTAGYLPVFFCRYISLTVVEFRVVSPATAVVALKMSWVRPIERVASCADTL